jgi:predicted lipoprotein with Yx(FWY)xxD motif
VIKTRVPLLAVAAMAMIGIAGCSPTSAPPAAEETAEEAPEETTPAEEEPSEAPAEGDAALMVASTDLGDVVVDANGMTVYMFDNDTQGGDTSSCTGECLEQWPPVITTSETPTGTDITGELGTIETPEGELQVTLDGWPLYLWVNDKAPGDVTGQAVGGVWWVLGPDGQVIRDEPQSLGTGY